MRSRICFGTADPVVGASRLRSGDEVTRPAMIAIKRANGRLALGLVPVLEVFPRAPASVRAPGAAQSVMARDDADPADAPGKDAVVCRICGGRDHELVYAARKSSGSRGRPDVSPYSCAS